MQLLLLLIFVVFSPLSLDIELDLAGTGRTLRLLLIVLAVVAATLVIVLAVPRWRTVLTDRVRQMLGEARNAIAGLRSPYRLGMLFGGNLMTEVLFATSFPHAAEANSGSRHHGSPRFKWCGSAVFSDPRGREVDELADRDPPHLSRPQHRPRRRSTSGPGAQRSSGTG